MNNKLFTVIAVFMFSVNLAFAENEFSNKQKAILNATPMQVEMPVAAGAKMQKQKVLKNTVFATTPYTDFDLSGVLVGFGGCYKSIINYRFPADIFAEVTKITEDGRPEWSHKVLLGNVVTKPPKLKSSLPIQVKSHNFDRGCDSSVGESADIMFEEMGRYIVRLETDTMQSPLTQEFVIGPIVDAWFYTETQDGIEKAMLSFTSPFGLSSDQFSNLAVNIGEGMIVKQIDSLKASDIVKGVFHLELGDLEKLFTPSVCRALGDTTKIVFSGNINDDIWKILADTTIYTGIVCGNTSYEGEKG